MTVYKIRRLSDGKFCQGGEYCHFGKNGKIWTEKSLKGHLGWAPRESSIIEDPHTNCEVVAFKMTETEVSGLTVWYDKAWRDKQDRMAKEDKRIEAEQMRVFGETF